MWRNSGVKFHSCGKTGHETTCRDARTEAETGFSDGAQVAPFHNLALERKAFRGPGDELALVPAVEAAGESGRRNAGQQGPASAPAAEAALVTAREPGAAAFQDAVEQAVVGVLIVASGRIVYANTEAARLFGYGSREDLTALGHVDLMLAESERPGLRRITSALLAGRRTLTVYDALGLRADGSRIQVEVRPSATRWNGRAAVCAVVVDVTERREAETLALSQIAELAHFDRICTLGQMSATIMHEIAQPLTALSIAGGAVRRLLSQPEPRLDGARRAAEAIDAEAKRMRDTVDRIKQFAAGNARSGQDSWEVIDVMSAIEQAFLLTAPAFNAAGIARGSQCDAELPARQVLADQVQLGQVLVNLVTNALDSVAASGASDGKVSIRARGAGGDVIIDVIDNGAGIPLEIAERIFDPFFSTKPKGVGIGLAVCRSIVDSFGGSLRHLPAAGGRGAVFRLRLPCAGRS